MTHQNCIKNQNYSNTDSYLLMLRLEEKPNGDPKSQLSFLRFWSQFFHDGDNTYCSLWIVVGGPMCNITLWYDHFKKLFRICGKKAWNVFCNENIYFSLKIFSLNISPAPVRSLTNKNDSYRIIIDKSCSAKQKMWILLPVTVITKLYKL